MNVKKSMDKSDKPYVVNVLAYGSPGVGKTTFATSHKEGERVLLADAEGGSKLLGASGIDVDIAEVREWSDLREVYKLAADGAYTRVVLDPLGELMDKLSKTLKREGYANGEVLSLPGWQIAKDRFRDLVRSFRDLGQAKGFDTVLVAHVIESKNEDTVTMRPKLPANLDVDVCALMDVVTYIEAYQLSTDEIGRRAHFSPSPKFYAKCWGNILPPHMDNVTMREVREAIGKNEAIAGLYGKKE